MPALFTPSPRTVLRLPAFLCWHLSPPAGSLRVVACSVALLFTVLLFAPAFLRTISPSFAPRRTADTLFALLKEKSCSDSFVDSRYRCLPWWNFLLLFLQTLFKHTSAHAFAHCNIAFLTTFGLTRFWFYAVRDCLFYVDLPTTRVCPTPFYTPDFTFLRAVPFNVLYYTLHTTYIFLPVCMNSCQRFAFIHRCLRFLTIPHPPHHANTFTGLPGSRIRHHRFTDPLGVTTRCFVVRFTLRLTVIPRFIILIFAIPLAAVRSLHRVPAFAVGRFGLSTGLPSLPVIILDALPPAFTFSGAVPHGYRFQLNLRHG